MPGDDGVVYVLDPPGETLRFGHRHDGDLIELDRQPVGDEINRVLTEHLCLVCGDRFIESMPSSGR